MKHLNIEKIFVENQGILRTSELKNLGVSENQLQNYYQQGLLERVKKGIYKWADSEICACDNEWIEAQKLVPQGVFCLSSAAYFHELSTFIPSAYQMASAKHRKPFDEPMITIYHWENVELGIAYYDIEGYKVRVYAPEKTICDMIRFKHKVGWDISKETLKTYLNRKNRNIPLLMQYAEQLKIKEEVFKYLDILL